MTRYYVAQLNVAHLLAPLNSPQLKDFVDNLDRINRLADEAKGFVWRLQDDSGNATGVRLLDDDSLIVNLSVWESIDDLFQYTYYSDHADIFRRRHEWFEVMKAHHLVLWWTAAGTHPTVVEAGRRLEYLREHGPSPKAFTFKTRFDPPTA